MANNTPRMRDTGANYQFYDKKLWASVPHSKFDLSFINSFTVPNGGAIIPVCFMEVLPTDSVDVAVEAIIKVNPTVVPLMSRQRVVFHAYYMAMSDLYKQAETFISKGHTRAASPRMPLIGDTFEVNGNQVSNLGDKNHAIALTDKVTPHSLADYLGLPLGLTYEQLNKENVTALPFFMYEAIWRYEYVTQNFFNDDRGMLPDDASDFRLDESGAIISTRNASQTVSDRNVGLGILRYRNYPDDYFTAARSTPIYGDTPSLSYNLVGTEDIPVSVKIVGTSGSVSYISNAFLVGFNYVNSTTSPLVISNDTAPTLDRHRVLHPAAGYSLSFSNAPSGSFTGTSGEVESSHLVLRGADFGAEDIHLSITLDDLRNLNAAQIELEKMARTDGSYTEFMETMYGKRPVRARRFAPQYIGGTYQPIVMDEVLNTTDSTGSAPLGQSAGHMYSASSGHLGHFVADDFGYLMVVMSIISDSYYSQGIHRQFTRTTQEDLMFPTRTRLGMQGIRNKELYASGDVTVDDDVFAYQDRGDEYRFRNNEVHGLIADWSNESYHPYIQQRHFDSTPAFNNKFVSTDPVSGISVDDSYLVSKPTATNGDPAYICQVANRITAVRGLPYKAIPEGLF